MIDLELVEENKPVELELEQNSKGGTKNYNELDNKPKINEVELQGNLTLEDLGIIVNAVKDILINGASVVENGVANIPIAQNSDDIYGLVKLNSYQGIGLKNGYLTFNSAGNWYIDNRNTSMMCAITPNNMDYTVKQAMTDGKGAEWTSREKANARKRLGMEWEVLADMTLTEDVNSIIVDTDLNGNPFQVRKMRITLLGSDIATNARLNLYSNPTLAQDTRNMQNVYFYQAITVGKTKKCVVEIGEKLNSGVCIVNCQATEYALDSAYALGINDFKAIATRENEFLDRIKMALPTDNVFKSGARVIVEGVR